jgi:hypothetical protein
MEFGVGAPDSVTVFVFVDGLVLMDGLTYHSKALKAYRTLPTLPLIKSCESLQSSLRTVLVR